MMFDLLKDEIPLLLYHGVLKSLRINDAKKNDLLYPQSLNHSLESVSTLQSPQI